jgi:hypothetical protein
MQLILKKNLMFFVRANPLGQAGQAMIVQARMILNFARFSGMAPVLLLLLAVATIGTAATEYEVCKDANNQGPML